MEHVIRNRIGHLFLMGFGKYDLIRLNGLIRSRSFGPRGPVASPNGAPALAKCFPRLRLSLSRHANLSPPPGWLKSIISLISLTREGARGRDVTIITIITIITLISL